MKNLVLRVSQHVWLHVLLSDWENYLILSRGHLLVTVLFAWLLRFVRKVYLELPMEILEAESQRLI